LFYLVAVVCMGGFANVCFLGARVPFKTGGGGYKQILPDALGLFKDRRFFKNRVVIFRSRS
jgi:hypothetical protein